MGEADIVRLYEIYHEAIKLEKKLHWGFKFTVDQGKFETAIEFKTIVPPLCQTGESRIIPLHPPIATDWNDAIKILCPDILDFNNRIIIEYEEETGNRRKGAFLAKKGHGHPGDLTNIHDTNRDEFYEYSGFRVCKIWESEFKLNTWKNKLFHFLADCFCNRKIVIYSNVSSPGTKEIAKT